jgi:ectoine hydroxylase-related dioxygenase (phytanoyl-CoA dioxygenase family)
MRIETISVGESTPERICEALASDGAIIVENMMNEATRKQFMSELACFIDATETGQDGFSGTLTTRTGALAARSATARSMILDPLALDSARCFLKPWCDQIQLHVTQIIRILPGQEAQPLHRDRMAWSSHLPRHVEPQFNMIWAITEFTRENGATIIAPGSQNWDEDRWPDETELVQAEMKAGSVLMFSGSVIHGGGANRTNEVRVGVNLDYCLAWLRQEENQYLCCPPHVARTFPKPLQDLCGYSFGSLNLGYYSHPDLIDSRAGILFPEEALKC